MAGQMVTEGAFQWKIKPWILRLFTRGLSVTPAIVVAGIYGEAGVSQALQNSQVALIVALPFISAPLVWFTAQNKYMTVQTGNARYLVESGEAGHASRFASRNDDEASGSTGLVKMGNSWYTTTAGGLIWLVITIMNVANIVLVAKGK